MKQWHLAAGLALGWGFLGLLMLHNYFHPLPTTRASVLAFKVPARCFPYLTDYVGTKQTSHMTAVRYFHMKEILAVCEAGKDPSKVAYKDLLRSDYDIAIFNEMRRERVSGGGVDGD